MEHRAKRGMSDVRAACMPRADGSLKSQAAFPGNP
ncbi:MAG: hypothetical protein ACK4FZ_00535 [Vogesella sp.]